MPKMTGRGVFFAALAVPFALAVAPLTASAEAPDDVVITDQMVAGGVATPAGSAAMASATTTTATESEDVDVEYVEETEEGEDWYGPDPNLTAAPEEYEVVYSTEDEDAVEDAVVYAVEDESDEVVVEEADTEAVAVVPAHEIVVVEDDDDVVEWTNDDWAGATYEDLAAYAGPDGAWVSSTEAGAVSHGHGGLSGSDTAVWYEDVTAGAGSDGAFVESTESGAFESDGTHYGHDGWHHGDIVDFDDDATGATYEHEAAHAGSGGAWAENVEAHAFELD